MSYLGFNSAEMISDVLTSGKIFLLSKLDILEDAMKEQSENSPKSLSKGGIHDPVEFRKKGWIQVCSAERIERSILRISHEILERNSGVENLAIVGIRTRGEIIAQRIVACIEASEKKAPVHGHVDVTLYRDDIPTSEIPQLIDTELPFDVETHRIILVDDVLYTGRTVRAALDGIIDFGRPKQIQLAVLCDRGHRELPVEAKYIGKRLLTSPEDNVRVCMTERDGEDGIYLGKVKK